MGGLLSIEGHSFQSVLTIIPQGGRHELPFHSGLLAFSGKTNQSYCYNMITNNILTLGATNNVGTININGGSGSYEYNIVAFIS